MDHSTDPSAAQAITVPHDADLRPSKPPGRPGRSRGIRRVVLWIVGLVGMAIVGAILVLRWTDGDVIEPSTKADLDGYCSALELNIDSGLAQLGPTATADQRRAAAATLPLLYSSGFVDGAPAARRSTAGRLHEAVGDLDGEATIDPVDAAAVREPFMELQRFRATDCP